MKFSIATARDQHLVKSEAELRAKHAKSIAKMIDRGVRGIRVHESSLPKAARVNHGNWIFDCECGAGVAADPGYSAGYCFGCGAIHTNVVMPAEEERLNIEHVLLARPRTANRNWHPGETLIELLADNGQIGARL